MRRLALPLVLALSATRSWGAAIALPTGVTVTNTSATPHCGSTLPLACCD